MQLISFYNSRILPVSSRTLSRYSIEVLDFVPIIVHEEVVDLVEVVRLLKEHDKFLLFETR